MLKNVRNITLAIAALLLVNFSFGLFLAREANAGSVGGTGGATEITQLINKAQLVSQSARQELQLIQQIEQTYLQKLQQLKLDLGEHTSTYQNLLKTYQNVADVSNKLAHFQGSLGRVNGVLEDRYRQFSASSLSMGDWMARERSMISQGDERARAQIIANREVFESTKTSMEAYQRAAERMQSSTGTHQATQLLGAQLSMLGGDLNRLISITALENANRAAERQEEKAVRERGLHEAERVWKAQQEINARRKAELEAWAAGKGK
ncbi:MAG: hypothetical protein Q8J72_10200 [Rhodocyclaceae bacterium]|nr:hypothetical protein [Rhodocyclaceae bacterium]